MKTLRDAHGITIAGGQAELTGKIFRIASMGYIQEEDIRVALRALEQVLKELGWAVPA